MKFHPNFIVVFIIAYTSTIHAKREESLFETTTDCNRCPETIPDWENGEKCDDRALDGCRCTYPDEGNPYCHLQCDVGGEWTMTCPTTITNYNREENDECVCPTKNPAYKNRNSCDSASWDMCKKKCTYSDPLCSISCDDNQWVERCVEHFESNSTLRCENGRCSLTDECQIPRAGGYSITGPHLSGMIGEYQLTPDGCTGTCTGCVLSSSARTHSILTSHVTVYASLVVLALTTLLY